MNSEEEFAVMEIEIDRIALRNCGHYVIIRKHRVD